jgi:hypothetical protein
MSTHDDFQQEPVPPAPKSSGSKVLLILGTIFGLGLVVCCGGGTMAYFWIRAKVGDSFSMSYSADEVKANGEEVAHIDYPDSYKPVFSMRISPPGGFSMKMIMYQVGSSNQGVLMLMETDQPGADPKQMREQMLQQMRSQQAGAGGMNTQIVAQSTETKMFEINGENVEFDFVKGTRPGDPTVFRQVTGTFGGRKGTVLLMLLVPDSEYDEEAVKKMITSIRVPGKPAGSDASTDSQEMHAGPDEDSEMPETEGKENPAAEQAPETEATPEKTE